MKITKAYVILLLLLCAAFIAGCKQQPVDERTLSVFELQYSDAMIQAYRNTPLCEDPANAANEIAQKQNAPGTYSYYGLRYYGTFNDCSVFYYIPNAHYFDVGWETIAVEYVLVDEQITSGVIRAYRDGVRYRWYDAYNNGFLTVEDFEVIAKRHYEYEQAVKAYEEGQQ